MSTYGSMDDRQPLIAQVSVECPADLPGKDMGRPRKEGCMAPNGPGSRMIALLLMSLVGFGAFFCFDNPGALQQEVKKELGLTTAQFASLYSWYSWPNVFLPVIGGFLIDRVLGVRLGLVIFSGFILAGQIVLSIGGFLDTLWFMDVGRFIFGVGGESLNMALNTYTVRWFRGNELNLVFGLQLSIARVGSTVNFLVMEPLYEALSCPTCHVLGLSLLLAASLTVLSFLCSLILGWLDRRRERSLRAKEQQEEQLPAISLTDVLNLPVSFWLLCLCTLAYYGSIFPFVSLAQGFFSQKFGLPEAEANFITGLVYLVSALASPFFGFMIDKTGRNVSWVMTAVTASSISHLMLALLPPSNSPYPAVVLLGLAYSILASALWSLPALLVQPHQLATAFGLMQALQNLGTALITLGAGSIVDKFGYFWLELFFVFWLCVALASSVCIWLVDLARGGHLNTSFSPPEKEVEEGAGLNNNVEIYHDI